MGSKVMLLKVMSEAADVNIHSSIRQAVPAVVDFNSLSQARKIVIKVNICKTFPADSGATVDIRIAESMIKLIHEWNPRAEIYLVESDAGSRTGEEAFRETGYLTLEGCYENLHIVNLSKTGHFVLKAIDNRKFKYFKNGLKLSLVFLDCDFFISISKLKTHEFERFSGILKNQFGCLLTKNKEQYHPYLSEVICDVNSVLSPDLCIIDGLIGMEGRGPGFGDPKKMDVLIVGNDPVAVDCVAATVMGINPLAVPHLRFSGENNLGETKLRNILLLGENLASIESEFKLVPWRVLLFFRLSFKVRRLAAFFTRIGNSIVSVSRQLERLGGALYVRSFREILRRNFLTPLGNRVRMPKLVSKVLLMMYLALRKL